MNRRLRKMFPRSASKRRSNMFRRYIPIVYVVIGLFVASQHHYFVHLNSISHILSALLAVLLWPLLLLGVNLNIK
jgi:hypothetical protein